MTDQQPAETVRAGNRAHGFGMPCVACGTSTPGNCAGQPRPCVPTIDPEPSGGFLVPPGLRSAILQMVLETTPAGPKPPPPTRRERFRRKLTTWREQAARRAFKLIAGYWPDNRQDDW